MDRRLTYGENKDAAVNEVKECARLASIADAEVEILKYEKASYTGLVYPTEKYYPTWKLDENSAYISTAVKAYNGLFDKQPAIDKWTFSTNGVAISGLYGIPCLGLGPGNEVLAHATNEYCEIDQLNEAAAFYAGFIYELQN